MLPEVSALAGENLNREGLNPLVPFYVMTHFQNDIRAPRRARLARASRCAHKHDVPPEVGVRKALTHWHDISKSKECCSARARLCGGSSCAAAAARSCRKATDPPSAQSGAGKGAAQWRHRLGRLSVALRRPHKRAAALPADSRSALDEKPERASSSTAEPPAPPSLRSRRSICTQHSEVGREAARAGLCWLARTFSRGPRASADDRSARRDMPLMASCSAAPPPPLRVARRLQSSNSKVRASAGRA